VRYRVTHVRRPLRYRYQAIHLTVCVQYGFHPDGAIIDHYQALGLLNPLHQGAQANGYVPSAVHLKEHLAPVLVPAPFGPRYAWVVSNRTADAPRHWGNDVAHALTWRNNPSIHPAIPFKSSKRGGHISAGKRRRQN
jgi:hypothetical protein